jgi:multisubunit Na+/H+ antiporter MnhB subunit
MTAGSVGTWWRHGLVAAALIGLSVTLIGAVLSIRPDSRGLTGEVTRAMPSSGVLHPLTAVLLNFRGYDTLLEIGVLLVAVIAVWSLDHNPRRRFQWHPPAHSNPVLRVGLGILIPVMVLVAGYMVWVGAYRPGGAFQSGAILGAAAVTLISSGMIVAPFARNRGVRVLLASGFIFFVGVASATVVFKGRLLWYPIEWSGALILMIETLLSLSIGASLAVLFAAVAGLPDADADTDKPGGARS